MLQENAAEQEVSTETINQEESTETINQEESTETVNQETYEGDQGTQEEEFINQEAVRKKINKVVFQKHEALREKTAIAEENAALKAKLADIEKANEEIVVPDLPDTFDPDYETKIAERDEVIRKKVRADAKADAIKQQQEFTQQQQQQQHLQKIETSVNKMYEEGQKLGLTESQLKEADRRVSMFIKDPSLAQFILEQDNSALLVHYLSSNPVELEKISSMPAVKAAVYIATSVSPGANSVGASGSTLPSPLETLKGKAVKNQDPYLKGVTLE